MKLKMIGMDAIKRFIQLIQYKFDNYMPQFLNSYDKSGTPYPKMYILESRFNHLGDSKFHLCINNNNGDPTEYKTISDYALHAYSDENNDNIAQTYCKKNHTHVSDYVSFQSSYFHLNIGWQVIGIIEAPSEGWYYINATVIFSGDIDNDDTLYTLAMTPSSTDDLHTDNFNEDRPSGSSICGRIIQHARLNYSDLFYIREGEYINIGLHCSHDMTCEMVTIHGYRVE